MNRERGASLLIPVILILTAGAFAVVVAASQSGGDIEGSEAQADSMEALFLAETGVERATRRFLAGVACNALGETLSNLAEIGIPSGRSITISAGPNSATDFSGAVLPATQCRIQAAGAVSRNNVSRSVQAIIDRSDNLAGAPAVAGFDNPVGAVNAAASWTGGGYDYTGGNIAGAVNPPNCTRSAYLVKPRQGGGANAASSAGTAPMQFTVSLPATVLVRFDYRIVRIANSGSNACVSASGAGACPGAADATSPSGAAGDGEICFTLRDTAGVTYNSTKATVDQAANIPLSVTGPACTPTTQQGPTNANFTPCGLRYNAGGAAAVRFAMAGAGTRSFDRLGFQMFIPAGGQPFEMWIDNVTVTPNAAIGGIAAWRDCTVSACPSV